MFYAQQCLLAESESSQAALFFEWEGNCGCSAKEHAVFSTAAVIKGEECAHKEAERGR